MTTIELLGAVEAALQTDKHYRQCPIDPSDCVDCAVVVDRIEAAVRAAAPVITAAAWSIQAERAGLTVTPQWGVQLRDRVSLRDTEQQARALASVWHGEVLIRDTYTGATEWRPADA